MHLLQDTLGFAVLALAAAGLVGLFHITRFTFGRRDIPGRAGIAAAGMVIVASVLMVLALEVQNSRFQFLTAVECADPHADPNNCIAQTEATVASVWYYQNMRHADFWLVNFATGQPRTEFARDSLTRDDLTKGQTVLARVWQGKVASIAFRGKTVGSEEVGDDSFWFTIVVFFFVMFLGGAILDARRRLRRGQAQQLGLLGA